MNHLTKEVLLYTVLCALAALLWLPLAVATSDCGEPGPTTRPHRLSPPKQPTRDTPSWSRYNQDCRPDVRR
jgi:hypothetical protein